MEDGFDDTTLTADHTIPPPAAPAGPERLVAPLQVRDRERYEVIGEHGRGGLGRVSRARDKELGRDIAIKELIERGDVGEVRFLREALITARLEHPGIVPIHEAGRWPDGTPFYAMKLVSGRPLKQLIAARGTVEDRLGLLHHVIAVADAIAYAHGKGIIHRDLKPGNVIVGDFGETIVIDWGLAKDLSATKELSAREEPARALGSPDVTSVGTVVGTPAYMAPEQARGEPADRRVDVFAIGAMLWELCTSTRVPPDHGPLREKVLRRAKIDKDLATIIAKALAPHPDDRYRDAGELAADLKAFRAGARIAARDYSVLGALGHWGRRHRGLSISVAAAAIVAIAAVIGYVHNIALERDRADASALEARAQQRNAEQAKNEAVLEHAELQLHSDPTAALSILAGYRGADGPQLRRLRAEATGRGVATSILRPHAQSVRFLAPDASGAIVSLSQDRTIRVTRGSQSTTLASNVLMPVKFRYMPAAHVLAYATAPTGIALLSLTTHAITSVATGALRAMDLMPDGSRLAALTRDGTITVWSLAPRVEVIHQERLPDAIDFEFATSTRLVVQRPGALHMIFLDASRPAYTVPLASRDLEVDPERVLISDNQGHISLLSSELAVRSRISVCHLSVTNVDLVPHTDLVAFICEEGIAGVARYDHSASQLTVVDTFPTLERPNRIHADMMGKRILVSDGTNLVYLYDIATRMVARYEAAAQVSYVTLPAPEFDHLLVGDIHGNVRIWEPPRRDARKVLQAPSAVSGVAFDPGGQSIVTSAGDGLVRRIRLADGAVTELRGHTAAVTAAHLSPDGQSILSYGRDGTARVWRAATGAAVRVFADHASTVEGAGYIEAGRRAVSIGDDGRLLAWSPEAGDASVLFTRPVPLTALAVLGHSDRAVVQDVAGSIWEVSPGGAAREVRKADGASVTVLRASPDGRLVATGTDRGTVTVYDTTAWTPIATTQVGAGVRQITFDPRDRDLIIVAEDRQVHALALGTARTLPWRDVPMAARDIAYAPDGETVAFVCSDGGSWFYDIRNDVWAYTLDHPSDTFSGAFSPDGTLFASSDLRGTVTVRDVAATFAAAKRS